jgi:hypothetical protein
MNDLNNYAFIHFYVNERIFFFVDQSHFFAHVNAIIGGGSFEIIFSHKTLWEDAP